MKKLLVVAILAAISLSSANVIAGDSCSCTTTVPATAQAVTGYRTYSYQPGVSAYGSRSRVNQGHSYESATNKARGRVN